MVPVQKVASQENTAGLGTKHLNAPAIDKNTKKMNMIYEAGRAGKAAKLHSISTKRNESDSVKILQRLVSDPIGGGGRATSWEAIRKVGNDLRGGDRWGSRGTG